MHRVAIVGSGGHARVIVDILEALGATIVGFLDDMAPPETEKGGYRVVGTTADAGRLRDLLGFDSIFVAVGDNTSRGKLTGSITATVPGFTFLLAVHPAAVIARSAHVGPGTAVMAGAVVSPGCRLGVGTVVNTQASVDHDCELGMFSSIAPGATLAGSVVVGDYAAVGPGACVVETVRIGDHSVIGAGSVVTKDVPPGVVAYGSPARIVRPRRPEDPYLRKARK